MKNKLSKILGVAAAVSMLGSIATVVNADNSASAQEYTFEYRTVEDGAIITGITENSGNENITELYVPENTEIDGTKLDVIGVDNFAFADLDNLTTIYATSALNPEFMGNVAFMTKKSLTVFVENALGENPEKADVLNYVAGALNYNNKTEGWTEEELAEVEAKLTAKAVLAGVTEDMDIITALVTMLQNQDKMNLGESTKDKLAIWVSALKYSDIAVIAEKDWAIADYIAARIPFGIADSVKLTGDANEDGVVNVRDCAFIAAALANGKAEELPAHADYNGDKIVNVRDAAAIARDLANAKN